MTMTKFTMNLTMKFILEEEVAQAIQIIHGVILKAHKGMKILAG